MDYGGPYTILLSQRRGVKIQKAYICLFVCFAKKTIEIKSDVSTETFLAVLQCFVGRCGRCFHFYSDRGSNFVAAQRMK